MSEQLRAAGAFWDREVVEQNHVAWMALHPVRLHINSMIGGDVPLWPIEWFERFLAGRTFGRALSIGCGTGPLERQLIERGLCRSVDAFDGSVGSLRIARTAADAAGVGDRIRYFALDFNEPVLPRRRYDVVFFHQSAHHVAKLEKLYRAVLHALKPNGLLYLDEYVGPSRFDWTFELLEPQQRIYQALPEQVRLWPRLDLPIQMDDPSEAFRSSEIESQLAVGFDVLARRPYGGTLLAVVVPGLRPSAMTDVLIEQLVAEEKRLLASGVPSFYAVLVARPKRGLRKLFASAAYWFVPKAKRIVRELRARLQR